MSRAKPGAVTLAKEAPEAPDVRHSTVATFWALLLRDVAVLRKRLGEFVPRTVLQPLLLVFVLTYVFPKIGQAVGGGGRASEEFSTILVAGVVATSILFQGIQSVALPLVQEFGFTREIEDRVLAPLPVALVAVEKIVSGALQCLLAGLIVFPVAAFVPATPVHLSAHWPYALTLIPLACLMAGAMGLMFGTIFEPRTVPMLFGVVLIPITFLGCSYYTWESLEPIRWLQVFVLVNPLVYLSEGMRGALTDTAHIPLPIVYAVLAGFTGLFGWIGIRGFTRRVIS